MTLAQSHLAMSNDFAAIISATMAALLLLLIAEFQAGVRSNAAMATALAEKYADAVRDSFFEFWSGTPLVPEDKRRVDRELARYRELRRTSQRRVIWQYLFVLAGVALVYGLVRVILWAPHPEKELTTGACVAGTALLATAGSFVLIVAGFIARFVGAYRFRELQKGIELAELYGIPDARDALALHRRWEAETGGAPSLRGLPALLTAHLDLDRILGRLR
ncbi:hypothetical protein E5083_04130 [Streptomyces bauhiniae]|uniref:Uncharacterized protein n=1 Tax=Streptomyces bauhiniae TaxID=2340725 RepID=A0A4Z1DH53_9ACTN|nr:hypothetical protein [Streptomyces bauhiniae]TGN81701.1 hypothetical protein E5083_04130 [Streptomyces bauhiniae]